MVRQSTVLEQKAEGVRSGHRWARLAASRLLQSRFAPLAKPEESRRGNRRIVSALI